MKKRILAIVLTFSMLASVPVSAATVSDAQKKKTEAQNQLKSINSQIADLQNQRASVASEITSLGSELDELMVNMELLENDLQTKEQELADVEVELEAAIERERQQYEAMKLRIQYIYEEGDMDYLALILETKSIADFLTKSDFASEIRDQDRKLFAEYQQAKEEVEELKAQLEEEKAELEMLQEEYEQQKADTESKLAAKRAVEADFDSQLASAKEKAAAYRKTISEQDKQIRKLQAEAQKVVSAGTGTTAGTTGSTGSSGSSAAVVTGNSGKGSQIASYALRFVGNPYVYGGTSLTNGTDCSGFTQSVFRNFGISLPRTSGAQAGAGRAVSYSEAQPGDLICYSGHVAIYIGGGRIVHASTPKTGITTTSATYRSILAVRRCY